MFVQNLADVVYAVKMTHSVHKPVRTIVSQGKQQTFCDWSDLLKFPWIKMHGLPGSKN